MNPQQPQSATQAQAQPDASQYFANAIEEARRPSDMLVFVVTLAILLAIFILVAVLSTPVIVWIVIGLLALSLLLVRLDQTWFLNNAVKLDGSPYTYIDDVIREVSGNLGVKNVSVFTIRDTKEPIMVIGHFNRYGVIIDAEFMEVLGQDEARAIIAREIAQIKFKSAELSAFIEPLSEKLKLLGLGAFIKFLFGFWARRTEETANRLALLYVRDPHLLIKALIKSKIGKQFTELFDENTMLAQGQNQQTILQKLSEVLNSESSLLAQTKEILEYAHEQGIQNSPQPAAPINPTT